MDILRSDQGRRRRIKQIALWGAAAMAVALTMLGLARLSPAAPSVDRSTVVIDAVRRGPMRREVRGTGTLIPESIRWIPASTEGRIERIDIQPGTAVRPDSILLEMSNSELQLQALQAESELRAAEAALRELKVRLRSQQLDQEASAARVAADYKQAKLRADADAELARQGLIANLNRQISQSEAEELAHRNDIERKRLEIAGDSAAAQIAAQEAAVEQRRAIAIFRRTQVEALRVRAGMDGVLQQVPVEVGQRVMPGANLARVAQPGRLKAVIKVPETEARDVQVGLGAMVDTRNGSIRGHVARIDPAAQNGTVTVDIALDGPLPKVARPDLTVDGTIELERLDDVLYVGRPVQAVADGRIGVFRLDPDGLSATRVKVQLGRSSVSTIEIREGLQAGDRIVISDTSAWDGNDRIRLN
jgi:HlyD family secretion protein